MHRIWKRSGWLLDLTVKPCAYLLSRRPMRQDCGREVLKRLTQPGPRGKEAKSYLYIPDLEYAIADFSDFLNRCEYEPFLRVYDTQGMETKSIHELVNRGWTSKDESGSFREVMRTASFGHGRHGLETCLHMESFRTEQIDDGWDTPSIVVPLAIISSMRLRMWEMKVRGFRC